MKKFIPALCLLLSLNVFIAQAQIVDIHSFNSTTGSYPYGSLTLSGQILYGMTYEGGANNQGCVFAVDTNGNNYRDLFDFQDTTGEYPRGSLVLSDGFLYGMTTQGGASNNGNLFRVDTGGHNFKNLVDFNITNGKIPWGSPILLGSKLFGMTQSGGANGDGEIFSVDTIGNNFTRIFSFHDTGTTGSGPEGDLIFVNGKLYGMTEEGGVNFNGIIFSIDSNGHNFKDLVDFGGSSAPLGQYPKGSLTYAAGMLYGMAEQGGASDLGVVFSVDTNGNGYKVLQDFTGTNGNDPVGNLLLKGATLYGTTFAGGTHNDGNIFSIDTNGNNFADIADFDGTNGSAPAGTVTLANGILYGTLYQGANSYGAVFSTNICNLQVHIAGVDTVSCYGGTNSQPYAEITAGTPPYTFQWSGGGGTGDTAVGLGAGVYTLSVTDVNGCTGAGNYSITQPAQIVTSPSIQNVACFGGDNGGIALSVSGGNAPYTYTWAQVATADSSHFGLTAGSYSYTVTDASLCQVTATYTILQPAALQVLFDSLPQTGQSCNGAAGVLAIGGTSPYTYLWQTGMQTTDTIFGQCAGTYCCFITDHNGCADTICVTVNLATAISDISNAATITSYPEPNNGYFMIQGASVGQVLELYDYNGQKINTVVAGNANVQFDISDKANGLYLIRILSNDGSVINEQKIVKAQ